MRLGIRTYIPEPASKHKRRWTDKPSEHEQDVPQLKLAMRMIRSKGQWLQKHRTGRVERSFEPNMCENGRSETHVAARFR